jgi:hypothetical protein
MIDMTGKKYGEWTVLKLHSKGKNGNHAKWLCRCSCGREYIRYGQSLRWGKSKVCSRCNSNRGRYAQTKNSTVYFIRCGDYVKIGASKDVKKRMRGIEYNIPGDVKLELIDTDEAGTEELWHKIFEHRKHKGEWYYFGGNSDE